MDRECQQVRSVMDSFLSGELTVDGSHHVLRHFETCRECAAESARRERVRVLLSRAGPAVGDVDGLRLRITAAIDREQRPRLVRYCAAAAAMAAGVIVALWALRPIDVAAFSDAVNNHIVCALTRPASMTYDPARAAQRLSLDYRGFTVAVAEHYGSYDLIDAHMCPYHERQYVHLVYRHAGDVLSVFAEPAARGALPETPTVWPKGYAGVAATAKGHHIFLVYEPGDTPASVTKDMLSAVTAFFNQSPR